MKELERVTGKEARSEMSKSFNAIIDRVNEIIKWINAYEGKEAERLRIWQAYRERSGDTKNSTSVFKLLKNDETPSP